MVTFGSGSNYYMPMDREYGSAPTKPRDTNDVGVDIGDIGTSFGLGPIPNIPTIGARLRTGTKTAELTFMGAHKGSSQGHTPEMYGEMQRQALREMQKANEVNFTTHATVGVYGMAGMDQQGNFSRHAKGAAVDEIKRAIDFAADVARGGSVVVHTGEFQRAIVEADWNKDKKFKMFEKEEDVSSFKVVDTRTGGVIQEARKNRNVPRPLWKKYNPEDEFWGKNGGKAYVDHNGAEVKEGDYIDYWGNKVERSERVPRFDAKEGKFVTREVDWNELCKDAQEMTSEAKATWERWKRGEISDEKFKESPWSRFKEAKSIQEVDVRPEEAYIITTLENNAANSRGWAYNYAGRFEDHVKQREKILKALELYEKIEGATNEEEKWKLKQNVRDIYPGLVPEDAQMPTEILKDLLKETDRQIRSSRESSASQWSQAHEQMETMKHVESAETYAKKESYGAYADAGIQAMRRSMELDRKGQLKQPIFISMENLYPETYGAHPDELITLVKGSQERMAEVLQKNYKMSEEEAHKKAQDHIGATFDTGHFNMWRKYFQNDPAKTIEQNDKEFNQWFLNQVESLAKSGIVKHLHIVDNYGYQDEHLAPGQGNTPVKEAIKIFKKYGFNGEMIVEAGADYTTDTSGFQTMAKAWKYFGNPVYGGGISGGVQERRWGEVQYGYFGQTQPPYFTVGSYAPSEDWTVWSGTPLE